MLVELPNGILEGGDHFNLVEIDEIRGKQQNYLADKDLVVGNVGHVSKILNDVVKSLQTKQGIHWRGSLKEVLDRFCSGDLETILVKLRENTYGPRFYHESNCIHCNHLNKNLRIDLDKLEIKALPVEELADSSKRTLMLPKGKVEIELKPLLLKDIPELIKIGQQKRDQLITASLSLFIKRFGEKPKASQQDLDEMSASDLAYINEKVEEIKLEGTIDLDIINDCSGCKKEYTQKLNVYDPSFFVPTKVSTNILT